ncbi:MAG: adenylate/guanylate cyclase domain-containing protein [Candidatus Rokubacteria bacterium]|nr:adenylate/guanylate cyclase domain-containing protein [Candidatus Rokubacteria bacterium]
MSTESADRQRLAAILAADAYGYSRLMAIDERATGAALESGRRVFRAEIEAARGRVIDMAGDSVLAVFDSAVGAVSAALAIQRGLEESAGGVPGDQRLRFRIGIHLGDVMERPDGTVYGDGVNIAARLEGLAEPGGISVSVAVQGAVGNRLGVAFVDQGERPVKNMGTLRAYGVRPPGAAGATAPTAPAAPTTPAAPAAPAAGAAVVHRERPSIAVLPFANMSGDPEQEYFADGISEDIITELSRFRSLFVIARNSSFTYRGQAVDVRTVARELGVRYVLEGSVRRAGQRIRITGQLIDATNGHHVWAERYDRDLTDLFAVQDEVTRAIIGSIAPGIVMAEIQRSQTKAAVELDTWDRTMRAHWHIRRFTREDFAEAARLLEELLRQEPTNAVALGDLAFSLHFAAIFGWTDSPAAAMARMGDIARRAVQADGQDAAAHTSLAIHELFTDRHDEALRRLRRAIELNPNSSFAHGYVGVVHAFAGEPEPAIAAVQEAMRLSPRDLLTVIWRVVEGWAHLAAERFDEAADAARLAIEWNASFADAHAILTAALGHAGRLDEARAALDDLRTHFPGLTLHDHRLIRPFKKPRDQARLIEGLRKAGLAEG